VSYKKRHIQKILNYFIHPIISGLAEGLNNLIATVKKKAYPPNGGSRLDGITLNSKSCNRIKKYKLLTHTNV
jgi:hypothetical protein